ncbi:MAG: lamin tail domain-containing protein, partial [Flavobacteriia bacterium]
MKYFFALFFFALSLSVYAQFTEGFTDGDFSTSPTWQGDDSVFTIVNVAGNNKLRSNKVIPSTTFYLSSASTTATNCQWEFWTNLQINTSSANYVDIYLMADQSNLMSAGMNGYFVRIGGTTDEISLFKRVAGTATKIIDGTDGITNTSNNTLKIKVKRTSANDWTLERDITGAGTSYFAEGSVNDASVNSSSYFGVSITQSTASFILKHFFDDFYIGPIIYDVTPPVLLSVSAVNSTAVDVLFNEALDVTSASSITNFSLSPALTIASATIDGSNPALVHLLLGTAISNGTAYTLSTNNIADLSLNISGNQSAQFTYLVGEAPMKGDVIINEFMCDQSPVVGLPEVEYVEIFNKSTKYFDLTGWKLGDASSDGTLLSGWLYPGEYKILCSTGNIDTFSIQALGVTSFPSLNNSGDDIVLKDNNGNLLDKITYTDNWYQDPTKMDGGYSLELINPNDPCSAADNWIASNAVLGGTPGNQNSVYDATSDIQAPQITELIALAPNYLEIHFSEGMDSTSLKNANFLTNPMLTIANNFVPSAGSDMTTLQFVENLAGSQTYTISLQNVADCWMNNTSLSGVFALPEIAQVGDVVINEILFDPYTGGYDWIEVYNNSDKLLDLQNWSLGNFDNDTISNQKFVSDHFYLPAKGYAVLGKDSAFVKQNYPSAITGHFVYCETPSFNVDSSTVYLIFNNQVMDNVSYSVDWHFQLLDVTDGVSLERIDPSGSSNSSSNWHSAAEAIGFATPGGKNSQYRPTVSSGDFSFTSNTISPDNDGFEDVLQINYEMAETGLLATLTIYDDRGRVIRSLFKNELLGSSGVFNWDGVTDSG